MQELLILIVTWLAVNFALPATNEYPGVEFVPAARMVEIRLERLNFASGASAAARPTVHAEVSGEVYAIYDDRSRTIYLTETWGADSPADVSILVHELVHHLQNAGALPYACPEARELPAYLAQARWLAVFGTTLSSEFGLDAMTLHLRTHCMH